MRCLPLCRQIEGSVLRVPRKPKPLTHFAYAEAVNDRVTFEVLSFDKVMTFRNDAEYEYIWRPRFTIIPE